LAPRTMEDTQQEPAHQRVLVWQYEATRVYPLIGGKLHFTTHESDAKTEELIAAFPQLYFFSSVIPEAYIPFCADFGPNNICSVLDFCKVVRNVVHHPALADRLPVFYTDTSKPHVTNSTFLLCCYLMLEEGLTPEEAWSKFEHIRGLPLVPYRDATWHVPTFSLSILDCLRGLQKAISLHWLDPATFDVHLHEETYEAEHYDITKICPKFVAFATPKSEADQYSSVRLPEDHTEHFRSMGVTDVVRLSEEGIYDDEAFVKDGFQHHALEFEDCSTPSTDIVCEFLNVCDAAGDGSVAVHCLAGLGRTGTLIACYIIRNKGFTAAEAIGFIRLMRPGSVIGSQQQFLEQVEKASWDDNFPIFERSESKKVGKPKPKFRRARLPSDASMASTILRIVGGRDHSASDSGALSQDLSSCSVRSGRRSESLEEDDEDVTETSAEIARKMQRMQMGRDLLEAKTARFEKHLR